MTVLTSAQKIYVESLVHDIIDVNVTAQCFMTHALQVKKYNYMVWMVHLLTIHNFSVAEQPIVNGTSIIGTTIVL